MSSSGGRIHKFIASQDRQHCKLQYNQHKIDAHQLKDAFFISVSISIFQNLKLYPDSKFMFVAPGPL